MIVVNNNAGSLLSAPISDTDLSLSVTAGEGSKFPSLSAGQYFYATLIESTKIEIVKVTAKTVDAFTIVRAQDGTAAQSFTTVARLEQRWNRQQITDLLADSVTPKVVNIGFGVSQIDVTFSTPKTNTDYAVVPCFECDDANPIFLQWVLKSKSVNGFSILMNAATDSANYKLNYTVGNTI